MNGPKRSPSPGSATTSITLLLAGVLLLLAVGVAGAQSGLVWQAVHEQRSKGIVFATLDYERTLGTQIMQFRNMRLRITRAGRPVFDKLVCAGIGCWPGGYNRGSRSALVLRNVTGSAEPEVLVEIFTGGAHCCRDTVVASRGRAGYRWARHSWGDPGYRGQWQRGVFYFLSHDPAFAYAFTSFAESSFPAQAWTMTRSGRLRDVTRERLDYVRGNAARQWSWYQEYRRTGERSVRGILAAWCADQHLLGRGGECDAELERATQAGWLHTQNDGNYDSPAEYIVKLRRFLREQGYIR